MSTRAALLTGLALLIVLALVPADLTGLGIPYPGLKRYGTYILTLWLVTAIAAMGVTVVPLTDTIAEQAAELRARHNRLRLPDAIVLATAQELGGKVLSYDRRLSQLAGK